MGVLLARILRQREVYCRLQGRKEHDAFRMGRSLLKLRLEFKGEMRLWKSKQKADGRELVSQISFDFIARTMESQR